MVVEDYVKYREIGSTDNKIISCLSVAGSKKTPLCYSKVKLIKILTESVTWGEGGSKMPHFGVT